MTPVEVTDRAELARFLARHNADLVARNGELVEWSDTPPGDPAAVELAEANLLLH